jgi:hypothetical protein
VSCNIYLHPLHVCPVDRPDLCDAGGDGDWPQSSTAPDTPQPHQLGTRWLPACLNCASVTMFTAAQAAGCKLVTRCPRVLRGRTYTGYPGQSQQHPAINGAAGADDRPHNTVAQSSLSPEDFSIHALRFAPRCLARPRSRSAPFKSKSRFESPSGNTLLPLDFRLQTGGEVGIARV